jgi:hypothetical protein
VKTKKTKDDFFTTHLEARCKKTIEWDLETERWLRGLLKKLEKIPEFTALRAANPAAAAKWYFTTIPAF